MDGSGYWNMATSSEVPNVLEIALCETMKAKAACADLAVEEDVRNPYGGHDNELHQ